MKPTTLDILGTPFRIEWHENPFGVDESGDADGKYVGSSCTIKILDGKLPVQEKLQTLWHEVIHALEDMLHIEGLDERKVDMLATGIAYVMARNEFDVGSWDITQKE